MLKKLYFSFTILCLCPQVASGSNPGYVSEEILTESNLDEFIMSGKSPILYLEGLITDDEEEDEGGFGGTEGFQVNILNEDPPEETDKFITSGKYLSLYIEGSINDEGEEDEDHKGITGFRVNPLTERLPSGPMG